MSAGVTTQALTFRPSGQTFTTAPSWNTPELSKKAWELDGVGNWKDFDDQGLPQTTTIGTLNEYSNFKGNDLDYLKNGATFEDLPVTNNSGSITMRYRWDAFGRLRHVYNSAYGGTPPCGEYKYDAAGRRVWRKADTNRNGNPNEELRYIYDGDRLIEERNGNGHPGLVRRVSFGCGG